MRARFDGDLLGTVCDGELLRAGCNVELGVMES